MVNQGDGQVNRGMPSNAFTAIKPGSEPLDRSGHQIAQPVGPNAHTSTFSAEAHPPGSAPQDKSHAPNTDPGVLPRDGPYSTGIDAIPGSTSQDVYKGLGKPIQGQDSAELHHGGNHPGKRDRQGVTQWGEGELIETQEVHEKNQRGPAHNVTAADRKPEVVGGEGNQ
ncbi:hypothetical protein BJ508DRAFT_321708 [Ascobolus immersus RN42]|uniref:Uncharacterized protein n=1 Tax=Ascobolus immersus RN42 TaxID=1160509 RepID=A0A3N4IQS9_ASCIM|nr:hypothetical protein BJ508DRAFT_321708 [Ascobolus immersus RN42]